MKVLLVIIFITGCCATLSFAQSLDSVPQVDMIDVLLKELKINFRKNRDQKRVYFSLFPTQGTGGGRALVTAFSAAFYTGDRSNTRISSIYFIPYFSFNGKYGFIIRPNIWLSKNTWNFNGDYRILKYPQHTWGIGGGAGADVKTSIDNNYFRVYQTALKAIGHNWNIGIGYALDHHYGISEVTGSEFSGHLKSYPTGLDSTTTSSGLTFPIAYDSRPSTINPKKGTFFVASYRFNAPGLGSDHEWHSLYIDGRKYIPFSTTRQKVLALRSYYWTVLSGQVPYLDLPSVGWDLGIIPSGRGTPQGRYRSNALLYLESEYRFDISANGLFGGVLFSNVVSASEYGTQHFQSWHPAVGTGVRVKLNKYSRVNVLMDIAFSKGYTGLYLNIGEAF